MLRHRKWLACALALAGLAMSSVRAESPAALPLAADAPAKDVKPAAKPEAKPASDAFKCVFEEPECKRPLSFEIGYRSWLSEGTGEDTVLTGAPTNTFKFRETDAWIHEFKIDAVLNDRFVGRAVVGFGGINDGAFQINAGPQTDFDDDSVFYYTADLGIRLINRGDCKAKECDRSFFNLDIIGGYAYWKEEYDIVGPGGVGGFRDEYTRRGVRVGLQSSAGRGRWTLASHVVYLPYTNFNSESTSNGVVGFSIESDRGNGIMGDATVSYRIWNDLHLLAGYQVFHMTGEGNSAQGTLFLDDSRSTRHGLLFGISWRY